jgi:murein DD-endopeptidase MepM/ murein hydrolase activator NlpD
MPPPPGADADADGVANGLDLCPTTPSGVRSVKGGCALVEVIVAPAALLESSAGAVEQARLELRRWKKDGSLVRKHGKRLARGLDKLRRAGRELGTSPCGGARLGVGGLRASAAATSGISKLVTARQRAVAAAATRFYSRRPTASDASRFDVAYHMLELSGQEARSAHAGLKGIQRLFKRACDRSGARKGVTATVRSVSGDGSLARLSDGTTLVLGAATRIEALALGMRVHAKGIPLKNSSDGPEDALIAGEVVAAAGEQDLTPADTCAYDLRIAPVQDFSALAPDQVLYHDPRGYLFQSQPDRYLLESGMRIGAVRHGPNCEDHSLQVFLDYTDTSGAERQRPIGVLNGTPAQEEPAPIPTDVDPKELATLRFAAQKRKCDFSGSSEFPDCAPATTISTTSHAAVVNEQGGWGSALYDRSLFTVHDGTAQKEQFDTAALLGVDAETALPSPTVSGAGYALASGGSSYPRVESISQGESFAVHDDIPRPGIEADYDDNVVGIPGGLLSAFITGFRGQHPYHYVAAIPSIVTDRVSPCPGFPEDSFYKLPWAYKTTSTITQGNNWPTSHNGGQRFAFDFGMKDGVKGFATRGGAVDFAVDTRTATSNQNEGDPWVPGNVLRIKHQDNTFSWYEHMRKNGVNVDEDDIVERGNWVIVIGNTGNSTGAHLHYHVSTAGGPDDALGDNASRGSTIQIRFEVALPGGNPSQGPTSTVPCLIPPRKSSWASSNSRATGFAR